MQIAIHVIQTLLMQTSVKSQTYSLNGQKKMYIIRSRSQESLLTRKDCCTALHLECLRGLTSLLQLMLINYFAQ